MVAEEVGLTHAMRDAGMIVVLGGDGTVGPLPEENTFFGAPLLILALLPARRRTLGARVRTWAPGWLGVVAAVLAGGLIAGPIGATVFAVAVAAQAALRPRPRWQRIWTLGTVSGGLILAGAVLSRYPWRSVDGYVGHSAGVQALALISVATLVASVLSCERTPLAEPDEP